MIHKMTSPRDGHVRVIFELPACLWADRIYLVGDFNGWGAEPMPFVQGRDGVWRAAVDLVAGRSYQFRYLVDGVWQTDYHADGWVDNEYGAQNSIVDATLADEERVTIDRSSLLRERTREDRREFPQQGISPVIRRYGTGQYAPPAAKATG